MTSTEARKGMAQDRREPDAALPADLSELERQAEEARQKLADAERRAEEALDQAEHKLQELTAEQEASAEKLRREAREAAGPPAAGAPEGTEKEGE